MTTTSFRERLQAAVLERHCANHPLTEKWVQGKLSRNAMMGWAIEHWHWVSKMPQAAFYICAKAPKDVIASELENLHEETDEARPHLEIVLRFAKVNGANIEKIKAGRGLPTTEAWANWLVQVAKELPWIEVSRLSAMRGKVPGCAGSISMASICTTKWGISLAEEKGVR